MRSPPSFAGPAAAGQGPAGRRRGRQRGGARPLCQGQPGDPRDREKDLAVGPVEGKVMGHHLLGPPIQKTHPPVLALFGAALLTCAIFAGMNREQFERLRDLPGKTIRGDIRLVRSRAVSPLLIAEGIRIDNSQGVDARLTISYNPEVGSKSFNVHVPGIGPICRLDVDGPPSPGRSEPQALAARRTLSGTQSAGWRLRPARSFWPLGRRFVARVLPDGRHRS